MDDLLPKLHDNFKQHLDGMNLPVQMMLFDQNPFHASVDDDEIVYTEASILFIIDASNYVMELLKLNSSVSDKSAHKTLHSRILG